MYVNVFDFKTFYVSCVSFDRRDFERGAALSNWLQNTNLRWHRKIQNTHFSSKSLRSYLFEVQDYLCRGQGSRLGDMPMGDICWLSYNKHSASSVALGKIADLSAVVGTEVKYEISQGHMILKEILTCLNRNVTNR